jgi:hypothetical protein
MEFMEMERVKTNISALLMYKCRRSSIERLVSRNIIILFGTPCHAYSAYSTVKSPE